VAIPCHILCFDVVFFTIQFPADNPLLFAKIASFPPFDLSPAYSHCPDGAAANH
jgi:hypothetical protein